MRHLGLLLILLGCSGSPATTAATPDAAAAPAPQAEAPPALPKVEVSADGTHFDPAVAKAELPEGAYYCDMGTVHYARMEKGDNECPVCGMKLSHDGKKDKKK